MHKIYMWVNLKCPSHKLFCIVKGKLSKSQNVLLTKHNGENMQATFIHVEQMPTEINTITGDGRL